MESTTKVYSTECITTYEATEMTNTSDSCTTCGCDRDTFHIYFIVSACVNVCFVLVIVFSLIHKFFFKQEDDFLQFTADTSKHYVPGSFGKEWKKARASKVASIGSIRRLPAESTFQPKCRIPQNPLPAIPTEENRLSVGLTLNPLHESFSKEDISSSLRDLRETKSPRAKRSGLNRISRSFGKTDIPSIYMEMEGEKFRPFDKNPPSNSIEKSLIEQHLRRALMPNSSPAFDVESQKSTGTAPYLKPATVVGNSRSRFSGHMKTFATRKASHK